MQSSYGKIYYYLYNILLGIFVLMEIFQIILDINVFLDICYLGL